MSEHKIKQMNKKTFLLNNKYCIYCGSTSKNLTVDHCPPRCFFLKRGWPEGFMFAACEDCNKSARNDEQVVAVLMRFSLRDGISYEEEKEFKKQISGLKNNRSDILKEWTEPSTNEQKRIFKDYFGDSGNQLRYAGYKIIKIGPMTKDIIRKFTVKLAMALYYKHTSNIFEGAIYTACTNKFEHSNLDSVLNQMYELAPNLVIPSRSNNSLEKEFAYTYSWDEEQGIFCAFVQFFNEQFIFHIIAVNSSISDEINLTRSEHGSVFDETICQLTNNPNS